MRTGRPRFTETIETLTRAEDTFACDLPDAGGGADGLCAALSVAAARRAVPDLPPLRSVQFLRMKPLSGRAHLTVSRLDADDRRAMIGADMRGAAGIGARSHLVFGAASDHAADYDDVPMPDVPGPDEVAPWGPPDGAAPVRGFDMRLVGGAAPYSGAEEAQTLWWIRHEDDRARRGEGALLALADAPPSALSCLLTAPAPIGTLAWQADVLSSAHDSADGWYLCGVTADGAVEGFGAGAQVIWARDGEPVLAGRRSHLLLRM